jgi:hypothetical protein
MAPACFSTWETERLPMSIARPESPLQPGRTPGPTQDPRAFLKHFESGRRSAVANWFHFAVRAGASTPGDVRLAVWRTVQDRLQWGNETDAPWVLQALDTDPAGALAYAAHVLAYERLPDEARQRVKAERAVHFLKEAMRAKPVTEKQRLYLQALGYTGEAPADRAAASRMIDELRTQKNPTRQRGAPSQRQTS